MTVLITDPAARARATARATDLFWVQDALTEVQDRLSMINKPLSHAAIVTDFPQIWREFRAGSAPFRISCPIATFCLCRRRGLIW